jgi:hypothetical protein
MTMAPGMTAKCLGSVKGLLGYALIEIGKLVEWGLKEMKSSSEGSRIQTLEPDWPRGVADSENIGLSQYSENIWVSKIYPA